MFGYLQSTQQMNTQGIGLGLFICQQIVHQFNGDIFVKSQVKKGTRFTFSFLLDQPIPESKSLTFLKPSQNIELEESDSDSHNIGFDKQEHLEIRKQKKVIRRNTQIILPPGHVFLGKIPSLIESIEESFSNESVIKTNKV